jgi:parallel beta-helix repeat protein
MRRSVLKLLACLAVVFVALPKASGAVEASLSMPKRHLMQDEGGEQPSTEGDTGEQPSDEPSPLPIPSPEPSPPVVDVWPSPWVVGPLDPPPSSGGGSSPSSSKPKTTAEYCLSEYRYKNKRYVSNGTQLRSALKSAKPGDMIFVKDGTYKGAFEIRKKKGNVWRPITICGSSKVVINTPKNVGLLLHKTTYVNVVGITVRNASKGIRLETAVRCTLDKVTVTNTGAEGIHIQYRSHYNTVKNSNISNTGRRVKKVGEGIYLGSSANNVRRDVCIGYVVRFHHAPRCSLACYILLLSLCRCPHVSPRFNSPSRIACSLQEQDSQQQDHRHHC